MAWRLAVPYLTVLEDEKKAAVATAFGGEVGQPVANMKTTNPGKPETFRG